MTVRAEWDAVAVYTGSPCASPGRIMRELLEACQTRSTLPLLSWTFTDSLDSDGNAWTDTCLTIEIRHGGTILDALDRIVPFGYDWSVTSTFELRLVNRPAIGTPSAYVLPVEVPSGETVRRVDERTVVLVEGTGGELSETEAAAPIVSSLGRRERFERASTASGSALTTLGAAVLDDEQARRVACQIDVDTTDEARPFVDFDVGDDIGFFDPEKSDGPQTMRVLRITTLDDATARLDLNRVEAQDLEALAAAVSHLSTAGSGSLGQASGRVDTVGVEDGVDTETIYVEPAPHTHNLVDLSGKSAGGDLDGSYPNPGVAAVRGIVVDANPPGNDGDYLAWNETHDRLEFSRFPGFSVTNATRGPASAYPAGFYVWNTDDDAPNWSDGSVWRDSLGKIRPEATGDASAAVTADLTVTP